MYSTYARFLNLVIRLQLGMNVLLWAGTNFRNFLKLRKEAGIAEKITNHSLGLQVLLHFSVQMSQKRLLEMLLVIDRMRWSCMSIRPCNRGAPYQAFSFKGSNHSLLNLRKRIVRGRRSQNVLHLLSNHVIRAPLGRYFLV